jgi:hypothetical protein
MPNLNYIFKRIAGMDYGALLETARKVHVRSGKGTLASLADIVACGFRYQAGYMDYLVFEFDRLTAGDLYYARKKQCLRAAA